MAAMFCRVVRFCTRLCAVLAAAISVAGCAAPLLSVQSDPPDALVTVRDEKGQVVHGPVGSAITVPFKSKMTVSITPPAGHDDDWLGMTREIDQAAYERLPSVNEKTRALVVKLQKREFRELVYVELILDPHGKVRGLVTRSRAFYDTAEVGGAVPRLVVSLGDNTGIQGLSLSPAGDRIAYSVGSLDKSIKLAELASLANADLINLKGANIRAITLTGGGVQQITSEDFLDMFPTFSADGQALLIASNRRRPTRADLLKIPATGRGGVSNLYVDPRDATILRPSQSKDGTIAFGYYPEPGNVKRVEIWTIGGINGFPTQIAKGSQPMISPNGQRIAYIGEDGNLWVTDVDGSNQTQLTSGAPDIIKRYIDNLSPAERSVFDSNPQLYLQAINPFSFPSWSPDGRCILYTAMEGADATGRPNEDVWMMSANGSEKQQLTTNGSSDRYPLISPDGKAIYFMSNRGGNWNIWSISSPNLGAAPTQPKTSIR